MPFALIILSSTHCEVIRFDNILENTENKKILILGFLGIHVRARSEISSLLDILILDHSF